MGDKKLKDKTAHSESQEKLLFFIPPEKDEQRPERSSRYSSSHRQKSSNGYSSSSHRQKSSNGREVKGRGVPRYCPYSKSNAIEIIARAKKEAERGIKENDKPRERSYVSSIYSVKRENTSKPGPSSNIPNYESQAEEPIEVNGSNTVAEHIRYYIRRFDDGNTSLENRRNDNSPKDRRAHGSHKNRDRRSVDRNSDERRYNSTTPEKSHEHHDPTKFLASSSSASSHTLWHETLKRYGRRKKKNQKSGCELPKRSRDRPRRHRSPLRSSASVSPTRSPPRD
uniref:Uncharacterized protein n=1 Tax=Panagrolaimus davidi TaxID=227884 RepID=A0A914Q8U2_9BILA